MAALLKATCTHTAGVCDMLVCPRDVRAEFEALVANLAEFFAVDTMAVSVNTDNFGTLTRADVARLSATMARQRQEQGR